LGGFEVGLVGGGLGGAGQRFDLAGLEEVLAAVRGFDAVEGKLHVSRGGGVAEAGRGQSAMELT
jgi:hypothetical protein